MNFWEFDLFYWGLGCLIALASLIKLARQRQQQLIDLLRAYVEKHQPKPEEDGKAKT